MAYSGALTIKTSNDAVNAANYQVNRFAFNAPVMDVDELAACILAYFYTIEAVDVFAQNTRIVGIDSRPNGSSGAVAVPFPTTAYAALVVAVPALPSVTTYVGTIGAGNLAPLGTSISVSERTATVGPTGRGRHFLPFTSRNVVDTGGTLIPATGGAIEDAWNDFIRGDALVAGVPNPVVRPGSATGGGGHTITSVKAQPVFSNLESRRR